MDIFRKPTSGESFRPSARQWGAFVDAARDVQTLKKQLAERGAGSGLSMLKNSTGEDIPWLGVIAISNSVIDPDTATDAFKATILLQADDPPDDDTGLRRIAIAQQPIPDGELGLVMVTGITQVLLDNPDGSGYKFAAVVDGDNTKLELSDDGVVPVVWHKPATSGEHYGLVKLGAGPDPELAFFRIGDDGSLEECGAAVTGYRVNGPQLDCAEQQAEFGAGGAEQICPGVGWRGVAFGGVLDDSLPQADLGEVIVATYKGGEWIAVGSGHTNLLAVASGDTAAGDDGSFVAKVPHGSCQTIASDMYRERTLTALAVGVDIANGDDVILHWSGREWLAMRAAAEQLGCGLERDGDGAIQVDNAVLAGTGLDPEGSCALRVEQTILDRITDLEEAVAEILETLDDIADILDNHEQRIIDLEQCCYDNTQAIYECCYGKTAIDVVYSVTCVDGELVIESKCIYAKTCT